MKKTFLNRSLIVFVFSIILTNCGHNCNRSKLKKYKYPPETHVYFDVFKEGNWWVYSNTSKTISDSVFISNFEERMVENCQFKYTSFIRYMNLNYKYVFNDSPQPSGYKSREMVYETRTNKTLAYSISNLSGFSIAFIKEKILGSYDQSIQKQSLLIDDVTFDDVISDSVVSFAPGVGIIRIATKQDTFLLERFNVQ